MTRPSPERGRRWTRARNDHKTKAHKATKAELLAREAEHETETVDNEPVHSVPWEDPDDRPT